jgi:hypothetical protein
MKQAKQPARITGAQLWHQAQTCAQRSAILHHLAEEARDAFEALISTRPKMVLGNASGTSIEVARVDVVEAVVLELLTMAQQARDEAQQLLTEDIHAAAAKMQPVTGKAPRVDLPARVTGNAGARLEGPAWDTDEDDQGPQDVDDKQDGQGK